MICRLSVRDVDWVFPALGLLQLCCALKRERERDRERERELEPICRVRQESVAGI